MCSKFGKESGCAQSSLLALLAKTSTNSLRGSPSCALTWEWIRCPGGRKACSALWSCRRRLPTFPFSTVGSLLKAPVAMPPAEVESHLHRTIPFHETAVTYLSTHQVAQSSASSSDCIAPWRRVPQWPCRSCCVCSLAAETPRRLSPLSFEHTFIAKDHADVLPLKVPSV